MEDDTRSFNTTLHICSLSSKIYRLEKNRTAVEGQCRGRVTGIVSLDRVVGLACLSWEDQIS